MRALLRRHVLSRPLNLLRSLWGERDVKAHAQERQEVVSFEDLYHEQLQDMHSCERQLPGAWVRLGDAATHPQLKGILAALALETRQHLKRLHRILEDLDAGPDRAVCMVTSSIIAEGCAGIRNATRGAVCDARILCAGQKLQHHQIAAYGSLSILAELLLRRSDRLLLDATLQEVSGTQGKFAALASAYVAVLTYPAVDMAGRASCAIEQEEMAHA